MELSAYNINIMPLPTEDGGGFLASIEELPGCIADGESPDEALHELADAFEAWKHAHIEDGNEMPQPKSYSGNFITRIPKTLHARLAKRAAAEGVSINQMNLTFIAQGLEKK